MLCCALIKARVNGFGIFLAKFEDDFYCYLGAGDERRQTSLMIEQVD